MSRHEEYVDLAKVGKLFTIYEEVDFCRQCRHIMKEYSCDEKSVSGSESSGSVGDHVYSSLCPLCDISISQCKCYLEFNFSCDDCGEKSDECSCKKK
jgi:hypothetical protein